MCVCIYFFIRQGSLDYFEQERCVCVCALLFSRQGGLDCFERERCVCVLFTRQVLHYFEQERRLCCGWLLLFLLHVKSPEAVDGIFGLEHVGHGGIIHDDGGFQRLVTQEGQILHSQRNT